MVTNLTAGLATLRLEVAKENAWCRLWLIQHGQETPLGAEALQIVVDRLLSAIEFPEKLPSVSSAEDVPLRWCCGLAENHATIYVSLSESNLKLLFQDAEGELLGTVELSSAERAMWVGQLENLLSCHKTV